MDVTKVKRSMNKDQIPERIPAHGGYSSGGGGRTGGGVLSRGGMAHDGGGVSMRGGVVHEDMRVQYDETKDMNRKYWSQLQSLQSERDKAVENNRILNESVLVLRRKVEEMKKVDMQKAMEQKGFQRNQVDHEKLAKHYDQMCGQLKMLQHEREQQEQRHQQEKVDIEARLMDSLRSVKLSLEDCERDRDNFKFKLAEKKRELERAREQLSCLGPSQDSTKKEVSKIMDERDAMRAKLMEMKKERQTLQEKLVNANRSIESSKSGSTTVSQQVTELQLQVTSLQQQLYATRKDRDELMEANNDLRHSLDSVEIQLRDSENECQRLRQSLVDSQQRGISPSRRLVYERTSTSSGNLYSSGEVDDLRKFRHSGPSRERSQGSTDEDLNMSSDASDHPSSFSDLTSLTRTSSGQSGSLQPPRGPADKNSRKNLGKLSSSTSSLSNEPQGKLSDQNSLQLQKVLRLEKSLEEVRKENQNLNAKMTDVETERSDLTTQLESVKKQLELSRQELTSTSSKFKEARSQIDMLDKEKGVALRDNAASYEQFIQLETQLRELRAEKQIAEQQKDIAKKELDRVITDSVNAKKKLETIMIQRSKDAKELSAMRHIKDKTMQEMTELRKKLEQLQKSHDMMEEEAGTVKEVVHRTVQKASVHSRKGSSNTSLHMRPGGGDSAGGDVNVLRDLSTITEALQQLENDRRVIVRKLFPEGGADQSKSLNDIIHCIDGLFHDKFREDLIVEVDALHQSSSKHSEQRIFELKQKLEDISQENKSLKREVNTPSQLLVKAEQNRDQLSAEYAKLDLQLQQLKNRHSKLVEDHDKTLERVAERWKQNWPMEWDDGWEEKHVTVMLDAEGYAGFSVVGGCDQPQLPSPGAFFITMVNQGGPAEGLLKPGDVLESINGLSLNNAYHRDAVRAVKESKRSLNIGFRRRRHANHLMMGLVQPILSVPHLTPTSTATPTNLAPPALASEKPEQLEYSLYIDSKEKSDLGFRYDWSVVCKVSEVRSSGPADQILKPGDRILKVNETAITKEKPSVVKKLTKPHKNILKLTIERPSKQERTYMGQPPTTEQDTTLTPSSWSPKLKPGYSGSSSEVKRGQSWSDEHTPSYTSKNCDDFTEKSLSSHASFSTLDRVGLTHEHGAPPTKDYGGGAGEGGASYMPYAKSRSRESYGSRDSKEGFSQDTQSQDSGSRPTKLISMATRVRGQNGNQGSSALPSSARPSSDGMMYGDYNERRLEYEDILTSERSDSQYSQSESYLSESSYDYGLSSSQSIDLTFHTVSTIPTHNRLTVDTMMTTQAPTQLQPHSEDEEGGVGFLARDDVSRTTFRTRNVSDSAANTNGNNSEMTSGAADRPESSQSQSLSQEFSRERRMYGMGIRRKGKPKHHKSNSVNGSRLLSKLSSSDQNLTKTSSNLSMRGRSRSQLSLGRAPSMQSVIEEPPRKSISTTDMSSYDHDPLADASYIRANFTYTPRNPKELSIKAGDVFHIHDEAPSERFRSSFWVSRLNEDGTDEQIGAIPNSMRGQEYLNDQGETLDFALYEEVEPYTGLRPVVILGALADQVVTALLENLPNMFYQCERGFIGSTGRVTEARLGRELSEKKIIDFTLKEGGFDIIKLSSITMPPSKTKHCLMTGSPRAVQTLKAVAPPISILVKALTSESITTFSPEPISIKEAEEVFTTAKELEENHANEFTGSLFLIYMETLMGQIEDIIRAEKRKQAWVPVSRPENS